MKTALLSILIFSQTAVCFGVERISGVVFNNGKVQPVFITPGRMTLVMSYCPVKATPTGSDADVKAEVSPFDATQVYISLKKPNSQGTNVFIICPHEPPMVLEMVPSQDTHQDIVKIVAAYGSAELQGVSLVEVDSTTQRGSQKGNKK